MKDYLRNGSISRSEIVNEIKNGTLEKQDIKELIGRAAVADSFIGLNYSKKVGQEQWTKKYLEKLVLAAVAESFNEDYLYYLYDVAKYVRDNEKKKGHIRTVAIMVGIVVVVVAIVLIVMAIRK